MSIARDMPRIPALHGSAMCDVSCIVGMFIYGIKTVFVHCAGLSRVQLAPTGEYREYNSLLQGNIGSTTRSYRGISGVQLAPTGEYREYNSLLQGNIGSTTRSHRGISRVQLALTGE